MSRFSDEIYRALTGRTGGPVETFDDMVREMAEWRALRGESRRAQARRTGIPESSLRRFEKNAATPPTTPSGRAAHERAQAARLPAIVQAYRQAIADPEAVERWRNNGMTLHVTDVSVKGGSARRGDRDLTATQLRMRAGAGQRIVDAYMRGDDAGAARAFASGIGDPWSRGVLFRGWVAPDFEDLAADESGDWDSDYIAGGATVS